MARFHLNPETGEPGSCRARKNCPFGGDEIHFPDKNSARENFERTQQLLEDAASTKPKASRFTDAAFASTLKYEGKVPRWFKKIPTTLQKNFFGSEPELLDIIDGPNGKLAVVWEENSVEANDIWLGVERGYNTSRLTLRDARSGEVKAYLKAAYQTQESQERSYGTDEWRGFRYLAERESFYGMDKQYPEERDYKVGDDSFESTVINPPALETEEKLRSFVADARRTLHIYGGTRPEEMDEETLRKEVVKLQKVANERLATDLENYKTPYIDFSRVDDDKLRGKGLGHSLYIFAARKLSEKGLGLRASGLQSDEAQKSWRLMAADKRFPITVQNWFYKNGDHSSVSAGYVMDFTGQDQPTKRYALKLTEDDLFTP